MLIVKDRAHKLGPFYDTGQDKNVHIVHACGWGATDLPQGWVDSEPV